MARRKASNIPDQLLNQLLAGADPKSAFAKDGLLDELKKALAERALNAEIDHHLDSGEPDGRPKSRNVYGRKTVLTDTGKIALDIPRDRLSTFDPQPIAKYQRRFPGFDEKIVSMYARGMSVREIQGRRSGRPQRRWPSVTPPLPPHRRPGLGAPALMPRCRPLVGWRHQRRRPRPSPERRRQGAPIPLVSGNETPGLSPFSYRSLADFAS